MAWIALVAALALGSDLRHTPVVRAVQAATPWVVSIQATSIEEDPFGWGQRAREGAGSGVLIGDGLVLTNAHVVEGSADLRVHAADGRSWSGKILGIEPSLDLAVLKVGAEAGESIRIGASQGALLGETVIAIGNPFGLGQSVTTGVISQVEREMELQKGIIQGYIQTDAAINPGNSGGALVNLDGELIGINTAIFAKAEGIGFAIPVDRALKVARDLARFGQVDAPWLGVDLSDLTGRALRATQLKGGVYISRVYPTSSAILRAGEVIATVNGRELRSRADLNAFLATLRPGVAVELGIWSEGNMRVVRLPTGRVPDPLAEEIISSRLGISVIAENGRLWVSEVTRAGAWAEAGLRVGDAILALDGQAVSTPEELTTAIRRIKAAHRPNASFVVARNRARATFQIAL